MSEHVIHCAAGANSYDIIVARGVLDQAGTRMRDLTGGTRAAVLSDTNVAPLYLERLTASLQRAGYEVVPYVFPAGEQSKKLSTVVAFYEHMVRAGVTRTDCVVALSGGVCGDMAGFAAATYLRGLPYYQIPTSLLAMVDSSVGGKTGVDIEAGKNLVGAFYQPRAVFCDPALLSTLPERDFADGMAEVIKYGAILDAALFRALSEETLCADSPALDSVIARCISLKCDIVEKDEHDLGLRAILNFGHTLGHAAEKLADFTGLTHGSAVAGGMVLAGSIGEALGLTESGTAQQLAEMLERYDLPVTLPYPPDALCAAARSDKKNLAGRLKFVLLTRIGSAELHPMQLAELEATLAAIL